MRQPLKIGLVGLDTSHVEHFTRLLNDPNCPHHVEGGRVIIAFPGGSPDMEISRARVGGYAQKLRDGYGVRIVDSIEAVAEAVDVVFLESVDGRVHLEQFTSIAPFQRPTFIDKPFTTSYSEAEKIVALAQEKGIQLISSSALRFADALTTTMDNRAEEVLLGADCYGPMELQPTQPGLFWYGIHTVEMLYTAMGSGCEQVLSVANPDHDLVIGQWQDGRIGTIRGNRKGNFEFGAVLHYEQGSEHVDINKSQRPFYASLLEHLIQAFTTGEQWPSLTDTLEIIRFIEGANESRITGQPVALEATGRSYGTWN